MSDYFTLQVTVESENQTEALGRSIAQVVRPGDVLALMGTLGAGKTRLSRAISEALGVDPDAIGSPTFTLIHEYHGSIPVYHFDTYRLRTPDEFDDLGASDYWARFDGVCLVEWADRVLDRLPDTAWLVELKSIGEESRRITIRLRDRATFDQLSQKIADEHLSIAGTS